MPSSSPPPPSLSLCCRPVQYIHHSFINSENSSLVNCLGKFNLKRKLLKEKDIIKLQGFLCPLLVQEGCTEGTCAASRAALHRTAPCQGSHTPMFKAEHYVKPLPLSTGLLHQTLCPCLGCSRFPKGQAAKKLGRTGPCDSLRKERVEGLGGELLPVTALDFEFSARQAHASIPQLTKTNH